LGLLLLRFESATYRGSPPTYDEVRARLREWGPSTYDLEGVVAKGPELHVTTMLGASPVLLAYLRDALRQRGYVEVGAGDSDRRIPSFVACPWRSYGLFERLAHRFRPRFS
jgi:hypothetical protein